MKILTRSSIRFWTLTAIVQNIKKMRKQEEEYNKIAAEEPCYIGQVARKRALQARKNWVMLETELTGRKA